MEIRLAAAPADNAVRIIAVIIFFIALPLSARKGSMF
jgi:hypothetical protein